MGKYYKWLILPVLIGLIAVVISYPSKKAQTSEVVRVPETVETPPEKPYVPPDPQVEDIDRVELLRLTNEHRVANNIGKLVLSNAMNISAQEKCEDMVAKDYWSHDSPDGSDKFKFHKYQFRNYFKAGENLARGYPNTGALFTGWKNSTSHNTQLLDYEFNYVGFGVCKSPDFLGLGAEVLVVQHFITP